jgi:hypothetical protein
MFSGLLFYRNPISFIFLNRGTLNNYGPGQERNVRGG